MQKMTRQQAEDLLFHYGLAMPRCINAEQLYSMQQIAAQVEFKLNKGYYDD